MKMVSLTDIDFSRSVSQTLAQPPALLQNIVWLAVILTEISAFVVVIVVIAFLISVRYVFRFRTILGMGDAINRVSTRDSSN
jgi:hypothetical protein